MATRILFFMLFLTALLCLCKVEGAPLIQNKTEEHEPPKGQPIDFDLPYGKYLREVMDFLEGDPAFKQYLEKATEEDISSGNMAHQLEFVNHHVRNKLDEVKRRELHRLDTYARRMHELSNGVYSDGEMDNLGLDRSALSRPLHVDSRNPHTFEIDDLKKLISKTTADLEEANRQRRQEFKEYEMSKEMDRQAKLKQMDEEHRKQAEKEHEEQLKKQREHPKVHHPGSKQQLEEVWEKEDHLPAAEFDPDTLFSLHDLNGDGHWSEEELLTMFFKEASKEFDPTKGGDPREREEEMHRMKEHVMNETDTDRDGMISKKEFDAMVARQDFNQDPEWNGLDDQQIYNSQEFEEYQRLHPEYYPVPPVYVPPGGPQGVQHQYGPNGYPMYPPQGNQIDQMHPNPVHHPEGPMGYQGMGQHPQQFQQGTYQQPQFQQGIPQQQHFPQGSVQQQQQYQQGINQQPQFPQGSAQQQFQQGIQQQYQQGIHQQQQFPQGSAHQQQQLPQGSVQQQQQFQQLPQGSVQQQQQFQQPNQQHVQGQQQLNKGGLQSSTDESSKQHSSLPAVNKVPETVNTQSQQNNAVH